MTRALVALGSILLILVFATPARAADRKIVIGAS